MTKPFQRLDSESNSHVGNDFELVAQRYYADSGLQLKRSHTVQIGIAKKKKPHAFDLGSEFPKVLVECKSHRWTSGNNIPSAKLTVWNEAMYLFFATPKGYRKVLFVLRDYSSKKRETLAQYYVRTNPHLIPSDVEIWEFEEDTGSANRIK